MRQAPIALLAFLLTWGAGAAALADADGGAAAAVRGCCACSQCSDGDRCTDGETLVACSEACASAGCQRVDFSVVGTCGGGCGVDPAPAPEGAAQGSDAP